LPFLSLHNHIGKDRLKPLSCGEHNDASPNYVA